MKKLLIAVAAIAVAVATQAATFTWGTEGKAFSIATATLDAGLTADKYYAVASSGNANTMANQISSYSATWAYEITFTSGTDTDVISGSLGSSAFSSRMIQLSDLSSDLIVQTDPSTPVNYSIIITGTIKDGKGATWDLTSDAIVGTWNVPSLGDLALTTAGPAGFTAAPEPTSGLLLLLGVAGLALKRKRA